MRTPTGISVSYTHLQYAHARICSVLKKLEAAGVTFEGADALDASLLTDCLLYTSQPT